MNDQGGSGFMVAATLAPAVPRRLRGSPALAPLLRELELISRLPATLAVNAAAPLLAQLVRAPHLLTAHLPTLLETVAGRDPYVALRYDGESTGYSLQV